MTASTTGGLEGSTAQHSNSNDSSPSPATGNANAGLEGSAVQHSSSSDSSFTKAGRTRGPSAWENEQAALLYDELLRHVAGIKEPVATCNAGAARRGFAAPPSARQLITMLTHCVDYPELMQLVKQLAASYQVRIVEPKKPIQAAAAAEACGQHIVSIVSSHVQTWGSKDVKCTLQVLASLPYQDTHLVQRALQQILPLLPEMSIPDMADVAAALGKLRHYEQAFMEQLVACTRAKLGELDERSRAQLLVGLASLGHDDPAFIDEVLRRMLPSSPGSPGETYAHTKGDKDGKRAKGGTAGAPSAPSAPSAAKSASSKPRPAGFAARPAGVTSQHLSNTLWALSVLKHDAAAAFAPLVGAMAVPVLLSHDATPTVEERARVHHYLEAIEGYRQDKASSPHATAGNKIDVVQALAEHKVSKRQYSHLRHVCRVAWQRVVKEQLPVQTATQAKKQVRQALRQLPMFEEADYDDKADRVPKVDLTVVPLPGVKVAVVVDPPECFLSNDPTRPTGPAARRNHALQARSWKVVTVPLTEWVGLTTTRLNIEGVPDMQRVRKEYMQRRLDEIGLTAEHLQVHAKERERRQVERRKKTAEARRLCLLEKKRRQREALETREQRKAPGRREQREVHERRAQRLRRVPTGGNFFA